MFSSVSAISQIFTGPGYAALMNDGSVVTWGCSEYADSSSVASELSSDVVNIFSNIYSFAALKSDGSVVTWGEIDSSSASSELSSGVINIFSNKGCLLYTSPSPRD